MAADIAAELAVAAGFLFAMDALAHLKVTIGGFVVMLAGWAAAAVLARWGRGRAGLATVLELAVPAAWLALVTPALKQPWTIGQGAYAVAFIFFLWRAWRWRLDRLEAVGVNRRAEAGRMLLLGLATAGVVGPFFTDLQLGGTDARWYTGMFSDFLQQARAGFFPVFVGQGEFAFNGAVNLFRSAPLCLWLGGLADLATAQALSFVAVRNLAVILAALGAGFGLYAAWPELANLGPGPRPPAGWSRWSAVLMAILYVTCPGILHALYYYELQMTFTALLALPWIVAGNVRALHGTDGRGYLPLGIGLALAWMAHAPLAMIAVICTLALQTGRFIFEPRAVAQWKAAMGGAVIFVLLSAYYFLGMSELPAGPGVDLRQGAIFLVGMVTLVAGAVMLARRQYLAGGGAWLAAMALIGLSLPAWLPWAVGWSALFVAGAAIGRHWRTAEGAAALAGWAVVTMLLATAVAGLVTHGGHLPANLAPVKALAGNVALRSELFRPLPNPAGMVDFKAGGPGFAFWVLSVVALVIAWRRRDLAMVLLGSAILFLSLLVLGAPWVSDFAVGFAPPGIAYLITLPMLYRLVAPLVALTAAAAFLALGRLASDRPSWRRGSLLLLAASVAWSSWEAQKLVRYGAGHISSRATTELALAPENYVLGRYSHLMLVTPTAYVEGKQFPWLESRLYDAADNLIAGPDQLARQAEEFDSETLQLKSTTEQAGTDWLKVDPGWQVQPGDTLMLRLEVDPGINCTGYLILQSEHGYQEFNLTNDYAGTGFGLTPAAAHVLAVENPGTHIEHYRMRFSAAPGNTMPRDGSAWARLHLSRYDPEHAPVKVESLLPYRAQVVIERPGYLETPRQWLPGYRAWVDGVPAHAGESPGALVRVPVPAGRHEVELRYDGTPRLWFGLALSIATGIGLLGWWCTGGWNRRPRAQAGTWQRWTEAQRT
ncbi:MAG TPA: hypothetical protein VL200_15490 [Lacunisphaera sp.]|nr:hypothetical protein [Lacunisphaera sp.]